MERDPNPFALVTMAFLKALELKGKTRGRARLRWKLQLVELLRQRNLPESEASPIFEFIDWIVILPEDLEIVFQEELEKERERMPYITSVERVLERKALAQGRQEGRQEGTLTTVLRLLTRRFGALEPELEAQISGLELAQLESLSDTLLDFSSKPDLKAWLQANSAQAKS